MMTNFQPGQRVTLSANPTIQLAEYQYLKPMASVTFEIGDDPEQDIAEGRAALRRALYESIRTDLGLRNEIQNYIADNEELSLDALAEFCTEMAHDNEGEVEEGRQVQGGENGRPPKKAARRRKSK